MANKLNVGLIGYGLAGEVFHAPLIDNVSDLNLYAIVERHGNKSLQRYPSVKVYRESDQVCNDSAVDLVVVATPNSSHYDLACQALMAGKHVVVDKPFTLTSGQAQELIQLARKQQRLLSVFQNRRWDGDFRTVQQLIRENVLGDILEYEAHFDRFKPTVQLTAWRESGNLGSGILYDLGSHLIDQAVLLFGMPNSITADLRVQRVGAQAPDHFDILMDYGRLKVTLMAGMIERVQGPHFVVNGTKGTFIKYGLDPQESALKSGQTPACGDIRGVETEGQWGKLTACKGELNFTGKVATLPGCYQAYYENIAAAINAGTDLAVKPEEALQTIKLIEFAIKSNDEKRTVFLANH